MKVFVWKIAVLSGLLIVQGVSTARAAGGAVLIYSLTDLGALDNLPGQSKSTINEINDLGRIVGVNLTNGFYHAVLCDSNGWQDLGTLGGTNSAALGINPAGLVCGRSLPPNIGSGTNHAFLWTPGGTNGVLDNPQMQDLGTLGGNRSQADDINAVGQLCGFSRNTNGFDHFVLYTNGAIIDVHTNTSGLNYSYGTALNDAGHAVGIAYNNNFRSWSALYQNGITTTNLGNFGQALFSKSAALDLNNSDNIVGYVTDTNGFDQGFIYGDGNLGVIGTLGGHYSYAIAINNSNTVVGGSFVDASNTLYHAFVRIDGIMYDLNQHLNESGTNWVLSEARAINDLGQIAGVGTLSGVKHGFLLNQLIYYPPIAANFTVQKANSLLTFTIISNVAYFVQVKTNLAEPDWSDWASNVLADGSIITITNVGSSATPSLYYRIGYLIP